MSDFGDEGFFKLPAFKAEEALVGLKRSLRELRPLAERGNGFELSGKRVVELASDGTAITAKMAKKPAVTPQWDTWSLKDSADVRKCVEEVRKRLVQWQQDAD